MSTSVAAVACSDLPGMKNDSFSFLLLLLLPCEGCPKQVVDRNIYHHVTKIQQPDWPLATCATPNMSTLAAEEVACAGAGAGATGSSSCSASTELILHLHVSMQHSGYQSGVALGSKTLVSATQITTSRKFTTCRARRSTCMCRCQGPKSTRSPGAELQPVQ